MQRCKTTLKLYPNAAQMARLEAWTRLHLSDTRQLKPSQRCSACWELAPKTLAERMHVRPHCGNIMPRDQNSALVVLIDAHAVQQISFRDTPGTGVSARPKPLPRQRGKSRSLTREAHATTRCV
ncbi:transposase [Thiomonas sp. FB-Cd]|uniref:transposase n=1 Tax=Thiomonas sp. FB-Cd TaxID=1158292 RepID=UPI000A7C3AA1|nr:transposase [Thiomonas sp. FB-Cd]